MNEGNRGWASDTKNSFRKHHDFITVLCINLFNPDTDSVRRVQLLSSFRR